MNREKLYEILALSMCLVLLGVGLVGVASWYFVGISENPLQVLRATMSRWIVVIGVIFVGSLFLARASFKRGDAAVISASALSTLHIRNLAVLIGVALIVPVLLGIYVWIQLTSDGRASRNAYGLMSLMINLGPFLGLLGLIGIVYAGIKGLRAKHG